MPAAAKSALQGPWQRFQTLLGLAASLKYPPTCLQAHGRMGRTADQKKYSDKYICMGKTKSRLTAIQTLILAASGPDFGLGVPSGPGLPYGGSDARKRFPAESFCAALKFRAARNAFSG